MSRFTSSVPPSDSASDIILRTPTRADGADVWRLVRDSGALEANSSYAYLLLCDHFAETCVVAERGGELVGFVMAYRPPTHPEAVFVWQVAVADSARKQGLAGRMLHHLLELPACTEVRYLEATVAPSNTASRRLFQSFAERRGVPCQIGPGYESADFRYEEHESEELFRIGPLEKQ